VKAVRGARSRLGRMAALALVLVVPGCGHDAADREYLAALAGEETGMTREEQIAHVGRAIQIVPNRPAYYETRAVYWIDLRRFARARGDMDRVIELSDRPYARFLRGLISYQSGEFSKSLADFDAAIARQPGNDQFYRGRSLARSAIGDAVGGLQDAERLVALAPQMGESYYARAVALAGLGRDREAIPDLERAIRIRPELVYVHEGLARAHERLGESEEAERARRGAEEQLARNRHCAPCVDPFRY